jgi:hypothetical protein
MKCEHDAGPERRLAVLIYLLLFAACAPTSGAGGTAGSGGTAGGSGSNGGSGSGSLGGGGGGGGGTSGGGTTGAIDGGTSDAGGTSGGNDAGGTGGGAFACPTLTVPGTCSPPADLRCPYPKLSQTGCITATPFSDSTIPIKMASVVVPYEVNSPLWSDGAYKSRGMRLPTGGKIHVKDCVNNPAECCVLDQNAATTTCLPPADDGKWVLPAGTVMVKNFMFPDTSRPSGYKLVETRLFVHFATTQQLQGVDTDWVGYGYQWDDAQTDATIIGTLDYGSDVGVSAMFNVTPTKGGAMQTITWNYPSRNDCITCHTPITPQTTPVSGYTIGPETHQLNRVATGDTMNQIDKFAGMGMFETAPSKPYLEALVAPYPGQAGSPPAGATLDQKARSYLHANCAFCHRPDGKWSGFDVRYDVPLKSAAICNAIPGARAGDLGVTGATLLTPTEPMTSVIWLRMHDQKDDALGARMPEIGSWVVDTQGTQLISDWITSITACPM